MAYTSDVGDPPTYGITFTEYETVVTFESDMVMKTMIACGQVSLVDAFSIISNHADKAGVYTFGINVRDESDR